MSLRPSVQRGRIAQSLLGARVAGAPQCAGVLITAKKSWVTSAGHANSYVVSSLLPEGAGPTNSTLYLVVSGSKGVSVAGPWEASGCAPTLQRRLLSRLRGDACRPADRRRLRFPCDDQYRAILVQYGAASVALGLCRAAVQRPQTTSKIARFEHLGQRCRSAVSRSSMKWTRRAAHCRSTGSSTSRCG